MHNLNRMFRLIVFSACTLLSVQTSIAATGGDSLAVRARSEDVGSQDAIIATLYNVISGPAGEKRDWDRFRSLFIDEARLIPTGQNQEGRSVMRVLDVEGYISVAGARLEERGFFEREIGRTSEQFGSIAHVFSAYDSKWNEGDEKPFARGINSIQLYNDGTRWWIVTILWDSEREENPIPERYLRQVH